MKYKDVLEAVFHELRSAEAKHPTWPTDQIHAAGIMVEEAGETMQAAIDYTYDDPDKRDHHAQRIKVEAAQTAAMGIRLLMSLP